MPEPHAGIPAGAALAKRAFDVVLAAVGLTLASPVILVAWVVASIDTGANGFYSQTRIGRLGRPFKVVKIRTMRPGSDAGSTVTTSNDARVTPAGRFFRRSKIDELPQLLNVLAGSMSFVGPRPDTPGFADLLEGEDRVVLSVRPGITGPATLKYRDEESLLAAQPDPERYNREVIFPDKVRLNRKYVECYRFGEVLRLLALTFFTRREG
jgi:lipopolysaccharide/colanic/teichoic acid biosynthesis glycosyltransferase